LILLLYTTVSQGAQFYKHVDEVMNSPEQWYGKSMQLHGYVVDHSIEMRPNSMDYRFKIRSGDYNVLATYTGHRARYLQGRRRNRPDGKLSPQGFQAVDMTAKCPSKYEAAAIKPPTTGR
jgi:cytochrome c-type biogenesis protein CcmE